MGFDISQEGRAPGGTLISGHAKLKEYLPDIVRYVSSVPSLCCVEGPVKTKIAFRVVVGDGKLLYDTNFEAYNNDTVYKVMNTLMSGPAFFNAALLNSFKTMFNEKSKAGVKVRVKQLCFHVVILNLPNSGKGALPCSHRC